MAEKKPLNFQWAVNHGIAEEMRRDLPPDALVGFNMLPVEEIVGQVLSLAPIQTTLLTSEKGYAYLRKVQEVLKDG